MNNRNSRTIVAMAMIALTIVSAAIMVDAGENADGAVGDKILYNGVNYKVTNEFPREAMVIPLDVGTYSGAVNILTSVNGYSVKKINDGAFEGCTGMTSVTIPNTVTAIGDHAFKGCSGLTSATIPENTATIGKGAFEDCSNITKVTISSTVSSIGDLAFRGCSSVTEYIVAAGNAAFSSEAKVLMDHGKTKIIAYPAGMSGGFAVPNTVTEIVAYAFENAKVTGISYASPTLETIGDRAFYGSNLSGEMRIPSTVTSMGTGAFGNCNSLTAVVVDPANTVYDSDIYGILYKGTEIIQCPGGFTGGHEIAASATKIGDGAYGGCTNLTSVSFKGTVMIAIGAGSFEGCTGLNTMDLSKITAIGESAFSGCTSLQTADLSALATIEAGTFGGCTSLQTAIFKDDAVLGSHSFDGCAALSGVTFGTSMTIGEYSFRGCTSLSIGESYVCDFDKIGESAFQGCTAIMYLTLQTAVDLEKSSFEGCSKLNFVKVNTGSKDVGERAFYGCSQLVSFSFGTTSSIGKEAFYGCNRLEMATMSASSLGASSFYGCGSLISVSLPDAVTDIPKDCFHGCSALETITWNGIKTVGEKGFYGCSSMVTSMPSALETIGDEAFHGCISLDAVSLGDAVTAIGTSSFESCTGIVSLNIGNALPKIGDGAFRGCTSLTAITYGTTVKTIGSGAFDGCKKLITGIASTTESIGEYAYRGTAIESATLTDTLKTAGKGAFSDCVKLVSATISANADFKIIPAEMFSKCTALETVAWNPNSNVVRINDSAFSGCGSLEAISIPASVSYIGSNAFKECISLTKVTFEHTADPLSVTVAAGAFECGTSAHPVNLVMIVNPGTSANFIPAGTAYTTITRQDSSVVQYTVYFNSNGGTGSQTSVQGSGTVSLPSSSTFARSGYKFLGWSLTPDGSPVSSVSVGSGTAGHNTTVYAVWGKLFTITYDANGGTGTKVTETATDGSTYYIRDNIGYTKAGYILKGWSDSKTGTVALNSWTVAGDKTFYAIWVTSVKITYNANGGTGTAYAEDIAKGTAYTLPTHCGYDKTGFSFGGWSKTSNGTVVTSVDGTANITVYALWTDITYKIAYKSNGGSGTHAADTVAKGATAILDSSTTFTRSGYFFVGWSKTVTNPQIITSIPAVSSDQTVYAIWTDIQFTISYDANGGTGTHATDKVSKGGNIDLDTASTFKREGHMFSGWSLTAGGPTVKTLSAVSDDITVYAVWKVLYKVTYDANGGIGTQSSIEATAGSTVQLSASTTIAKDGYDFGGWSTTSDGKNIVKSLIISGDTTVYASWVASTGSDSPGSDSGNTVNGTGNWSQAPVMAIIPVILVCAVLGLIWYRTGRI